MAELADALDLGSSAARREGSSPSLPTRFDTMTVMIVNRLFIGGACLATLGAVFALTAQDDSPIEGYRNWHLVNKEPVLMETLVSTLCIQLPKWGPTNPHVPKYIKVYVNDMGREAMLSSRPVVFPVGSIIVKEKFKRGDDKNAELLTIMIKRAKSAEPSVSDWEFLTAPNEDRVLQNGDVSHCISCHAEEPKSDFTFKTYMQHKERAR